MKIVNCLFYRYSLPLTVTIKISGNEIPNRDGIIMVVEDDTGKRGLAEISPLPGLHRESMNDIIKLLPDVKRFLLSQESVDHNSIGYAFPPIIRFSVDTVLLSLKAMRNNLKLAEYVNPRAKNKVKVNALLLREELNNRQKIRQIKDAGYHNIKVKIRAHSMRKDAESITYINELFQGNVSFRIDANRSLSLRQALEFARRIKGITVDYFEEPIDNSEYLTRFYEESGYHFGVDETLWREDGKDWEIKRGLRAVIIKPQLFGDWSEIEKIIKHFRDNDVQTVISDIFSGGVGLNSLIQLAAAYGQPETAMGLYTCHYLKEDILQERLVFKNGLLDVRDSWHKARYLNEKRLTKLDI